MYGIQTHVTKSRTTNTFENDVKMYGIQTDEQSWDMNDSLRMM